MVLEKGELHLLTLVGQRFLEDRQVRLETLQNVFLGRKGKANF
jgi:hypothetical protein